MPRTRSHRGRGGGNRRDGGDKLSSPRAGGRSRATGWTPDMRGRKPASQRWLKRQASDPYVAEAHAQGYRARSAFKLAQIDDKFALLRRVGRVVDLGAAPGSWSQVVRARAPQARLVAIDQGEITPLDGVVTLQRDVEAPGLADDVRGELGGPADLVLSDMSPATTGHGQTDHLRIMALAQAAYATAQELLAPGGAFVCKVLHGGTEADLLAQLKQAFARVRHIKPEASRKESPETYVVALGFRGTASGDGN